MNTPLDQKELKIKKTKQKTKLEKTSSGHEGSGGWTHLAILPQLPLGIQAQLTSLNIKIELIRLTDSSRQ